MVIDVKYIKYIISLPSIFRLIFGFLVIIILDTLTLWLCVERRYQIETNKYILIIDSSSSTSVIKNNKEINNNTKNLALYRCKLIKCNTIYLLSSNYSLYTDTTKPDPSFTKVTGIVFNNYHPLFNKMYTKDGDIIVRYNNQSYFVDDSKYLNNIINLYYIILSTMFVVYIILFIYILSIKYKNNIYEKGTYKMYIENKLQRDVTEMIHHEMNMPLAIIRTIIEDFKDSSCYQEHAKKDRYISEKFENMELAIQRIESVLYLLQEAKHIKRNYGTISIYKIIENIIACVNSFNLSKIRAEYYDIDILKSYTTTLDVSSGTLLNIINVMVTNSKEAKASSITFRAHVNKGIMNLYIQDNGIGIRDKENKIINTDDIFSWGYSSKDNTGRHIIVKKTLLTRILKILRIKLTERSHTRGIGLYVNRSILRRANGDIKLLYTSEKGTTFIISIPVTKLKN